MTRPGMEATELFLKIIRSNQHLTVRKRGKSTIYPCPVILGPISSRWRCRLVLVRYSEEEISNGESDLLPLCPHRRLNVDSLAPEQGLAFQHAASTTIQARQKPDT